MKVSVENSQDLKAHIEKLKIKQLESSDKRVDEKSIARILTESDLDKFCELLEKNAKKTAPNQWSEEIIITSYNDRTFERYYHFFVDIPDAKKAIRQLWSEIRNYEETEHCFVVFYSGDELDYKCYNLYLEKDPDTLEKEEEEL